MGRILDVAPEWLAGLIPDDFPHQYAIHLYQQNTVTPQQLVNTVYVTMGCDPAEIAKDRRKYWGMYDAIMEAARKYAGRE